MSQQDRPPSSLSSPGSAPLGADLSGQVGFPLVNLSATQSIDATEPIRTPEHAPSVLEAIALSKSYEVGGERRCILDQVDFRVCAGEFVFLCGPSGSGKSTLLSILGCLLAADTGEVRLHGRRIDHLSEQARTKIRRDSMGFVFQRFQLIRGLTAEDNVAVPLRLQGIGVRESRVMAGDLLAKVGLSSQRRQLPSEMSPGQCQRVALARATITSPKIILADEPTAALDGKSGEESMSLLKELAIDNDSATVVVTHDPRILHHADRICEIENGRFK